MPAQDLLSLLPQARSYAVAPITNYYVGAVVRGASGNLYLGANIEIPANPLAVTVHAEQSAVANAFMAGETAITEIAVSAEPCGHCRQFLHEMTGANDLRILLENAEPTTLAELLPAPFGPANLGIQGTPFSSPPTPLRLDPPADEHLIANALQAAQRSYAPYTKAHAGVAIQTASGAIFQGAYIENAAFNPSLSPLQVALTVMARSAEPFSSIAKVVLIERQGTPISQLAATRSVLQAIAPQAILEAHLASPLS